MIFFVNIWYFLPPKLSKREPNNLINSQKLHGNKFLNMLKCWIVKIIQKFWWLPPVKTFFVWFFFFFFCILDPPPFRFYLSSNTKIAEDKYMNFYTKITLLMFLRCVKNNNNWSSVSRNRKLHFKAKISFYGIVGSFYPTTSPRIAQMAFNFQQR